MVILAVSTVLLASCGSKHLNALPPAPVSCIDIARIINGVEVGCEGSPRVNGTSFSDFYLNEYLQWKSN